MQINSAREHGRHMRAYNCDTQLSSHAKNETENTCVVPTKHFSTWPPHSFTTLTSAFRPQQRVLIAGCLPIGFFPAFTVTFHLVATNSHLLQSEPIDPPSGRLTAKMGRNRCTVHLVPPGCTPPHCSVLIASNVAILAVATGINLHRNKQVDRARILANLSFDLACHVIVLETTMTWHQWCNRIR